MFITIEENLVNLDKVNCIIVDEYEDGFVIRVQFERGNELTLFYYTEEEAMEAFKNIQSKL